jgi:hypothetical protein
MSECMEIKIDADYYINQMKELEENTRLIEENKEVWIQIKLLMKLTACENEKWY